MSERSFAERAAALVAQMTLEEKVSQIGNFNPALPRLGIKRYNFWNEGLHGVANTVKSRGEYATSYPYSIAMAASWDPALLRQIASASGDEARAYNNKGIRDLSYWCPTINMSRDPRWGRNHESYGEDNYLTTRLAIGFVDGYQGNGDGVPYLKTIATLKHYAANNSEYNRETGSSAVQNRFIREYFTRSFKDVIRHTPVASVMSAYNMVNHVPSSGSRYLLDTLLRRTFGFEGYVVSDCGAIKIISSPTHHHWNPPKWGLDGYGRYQDADGYVTKVGSVALCVDAGCDMDCGDVYPQNARAAVEAGLLDEAAIDRALTRIFTARMATGEFDPPEKVAYRGEAYSWDNQIECPAHTRLAEDSATQTIVLLKNDPAKGESAPLLPLDPAGIKKVVLVGPLAEKAELGGYSGTPSDGMMSTPREGIAKFVGDTAITCVSGQSSGGAFMGSLASLTVFFDDGDPVTLTAADAASYTGCERDGDRFRFIQPGGVIEFKDVKIKNANRVELQIAAGENTLGGHVEVRYGNAGGGMLADIPTVKTASGGDYVTVGGFNANGGYDKRDLYVVYCADESPVSFTPGEEAAIREADVVIACMGGINSSEGSDRATIALWNNQHALVAAVAAMNPRTVCHLQTVGVMEIESFKELTPAILWTCNNGQAQGNALGRVLFGDANPSAKLPFTWYSYNSELETIDDYDLVRDDYKCGGWTYQYFTGHVTYPFGHGLSYSRFVYANLRLDKTAVTPDGHIAVSVDVANQSAVDGKEVVQLYVCSPLADGKARPFKQLKGFEKVFIPAGQTKTVTLDLDLGEVYFWDEEGQKNVWDQGEYTLFVGPSSDESRALKAAFTLTGQPERAIAAVAVVPSGVILNAARPDRTLQSGLSVALKDDSFLDLTAPDVTVRYSSNRPDVAAVDDKGVVTPVGKGTATITVTVTVGESAGSASYPVAVEEELLPDGIAVDGLPLTDFAPEKTAYTLAVEGDVPPTVTATAGGSDVTAKQADALPGEATITLSNGNKTAAVTLRLLRRSTDHVAARFTAMDGSYAAADHPRHWLYADWTTADEAAPSIDLYSHRLADLHLRATLTLDGPAGLPDAAFSEGFVKLRSADDHGENHYGWAFADVGVRLKKGVNYLDIPLTAAGRHTWGKMDWGRLDRCLIGITSTEKLADDITMTLREVTVVDTSLGGERDALWAVIHDGVDPAGYTPATAAAYGAAYDAALRAVTDPAAGDERLAACRQALAAAKATLAPMDYIRKRFDSLARGFDSYLEDWDGSLHNERMWGNWSQDDGHPLDVADQPGRYCLQLTVTVSTVGGVVPPAGAWERIDLKVRSAMVPQKPGDEDPANREHNAGWVIKPAMVGKADPFGNGSRARIDGTPDRMRIAIPLDTPPATRRGIIDWADLRQALCVMWLTDAVRDERPVDKGHNYTMTISDPMIVDLAWVDRQKAALAARLEGSDPASAAARAAAALLADPFASPAALYAAEQAL
ncbi:MAG: glycoside hydrolase family 3 C-terminal domain-containing protein [Acutalibacteraceae bacterium]|jgi:beta-glucosidase